MFLHETYVVGGEDSNVEHYVSVTQIAQWLTDPDANKRTFTSLLQARYFHHVYNLVKWGKLSLTPAHTEIFELATPHRSGHCPHTRGEFI